MVYQGNASVQQSKQQRAFTKNSRNVMEVLVVEEVEQQFQALPAKTAKYTNPSEVIAYALNRLPALYATSKRGWQRQWHRGKTDLHPQIVTAVRQGIMAVQRDPLRSEGSLTFEEENAALAALQKLKVLFQREDLSWDNLNDVVEQALLDSSRGKISWHQHGVSQEEIFDWEKHPHYQNG